MFCPNCRTEYRDGFNKCADCEVRLVKVLTPEPEPESYDFVKVLSDLNQSDVAVIKSVFKEEGVIYYIHGEHSQRLVPLPFSAMLMVREDFVDDAEEILEELGLI